MSDDILERLRGVAAFYLSSPNMGDIVAHVHGVDGSHRLDARDLLGVADEIERLRAALGEMADVIALARRALDGEA